MASIFRAVRNVRPRISFRRLPVARKAIPIQLLHAIAFGAVLAVQLSMVVFRELPLVVADESVYLAHARYLSGAAPMPTLHGASFFAFGYSLFLIPAFWLFENPYSVYTASLAISAVLMSTLYFSLYFVLASLLGISPRLAVLASFITCLYPPLLLRSAFAWAENAYVPGFMLSILLFGLLVRSKSLRYALLFGLLTGFMYTIHARSLPLIPIAFLSVIYLGFARTLPWKAVGAAAAATSLVFMATRMGIDRLRTAVGSEIHENPIRPVIESLLTPAGIHDFVLKANEQTLYLAQSSLGVFLVGALFLAYWFWPLGDGGRAWRRWNVVATATLSFALLAWLGTFVLGAAWNSAFAEDVVALKGRFVDGASMVFLALGVVGVLTERQWWSWRRGAAMAALVAASTALAAYSLSVFPRTIFAPHSLGIVYFLDLFGPTALGLAVSSSIGIAGLTLLAWLEGRMRIAGAVAVGAVFLLLSGYTYFSTILPLQDRVARTASLAAYIRSYIGSPSAIAYDTASYHPLTYFTYEFLLPHTRFIPFDSSAGEVPTAPIVIASRSWLLADSLNAQFWQVEHAVAVVGADQALWSLPGTEYPAPLRQIDYANTVLGRDSLPAWSIPTHLGKPAQPVWGVWQRGFYIYTAPGPTQIDYVLLVDSAAMRVPTAARPPRALSINLNSPAKTAVPLQASVNGETIFDGSIPSGNWCGVFPLLEDSAESVLVEFSVPKDEFLLLRGIAVLDHVPEASEAEISGSPLPASSLRSTLSLETPPAPPLLARGAMGAMRLTVTNTGDHAWPTECEIGITPGVVQLGILWFPLNESGRALADRVAEHRAALPYGLSPGESVSLTAFLTPFDESGAPLAPGEYEVWIGPVQESVVWFYQHGDDMLKVPVRVIR